MRGRRRIVASLAVGAALLTGLASLAACRQWPGAAPAWPSLAELGARPNIVVVLSDTHRRDFASPYEPDGERLTPNIGLLATEGVRFADARTPVPISAPAYATLLTGMAPIAHGLLNNGQHLGADLPLLAEALARSGYATAAVLSNPFTGRAHGFGRGFDHVWDDIEDGGKEGDRVTAAALRWLESRPRDRPFFLFAAYMDAHSPFVSSGVPPSLAVSVGGVVCCVLRAENAHGAVRVPLRLAPGRTEVVLDYLGDLPPEQLASPLFVRGFEVADARLAFELVEGFAPVVEDARFRQLARHAVLAVTNPTSTILDSTLAFRAMRRYSQDEHARFYTEGVRAFDRHVGKLFGYLRRAGLWQQTVVVFVSDHGEMLGEHEAWGHVEFLWQEALRIPLVIKAPGLPAGAVYEDRFDLADLHRLLRAVGTGALEGDRRETFPFAEPDMSSVWVAATYPPESGSLAIAVQSGARKLLVTADGYQLFDLATDPRERVNRWSGNESTAPDRALAHAVSEVRRAIADAELLDPATLSEEERAQLEALGYLR